MILFSKREKLGKLFEKWAQKNSVCVCPISIIGWLDGKGMLNEEEILRFLEEQERENRMKTEQEYKNYIYSKAKQTTTKEQLDDLLNEIINDKELDYGKIIYAMCGAMLAVAHYVNNSPVGGITGFQASFVGWEMVKEFLITSNECGMKIVDFDKMLYPQYKYIFQKVIEENVWKELQKNAKQKLEKESQHAHPKVVKHWKSIVKGKVPFGYKVVKE